MLPPKKKRLPRTPKEKKFVKAYLQSGNGTEAALEAYDTTDPKTAAVIANQNLKRLNISELMDSMGLTDEFLLNKVTEGINNANRIHGTDNDFIEIPDYAVRHKYIETSLKLKDKFPSSRTDITSGGEVLKGNTIVFADFTK